MTDYIDDMAEGWREMAPAVEKWLLGDPNAVYFVRCLWEAAQLWDDLEDKDNGEVDHNAVLSWLAFEELRNDWIAANAHVLKPAVLRMYLDWTAANTLERGSKDDKRKAYVLRASFWGVIHTLAWLVGGDVHARSIGPEIWRAYGQTLPQFLQEVSKWGH